MPEATVLAFALLALLAFCRWLQEDRPVLLVGAAAATSMAALARPTSLHIGLELLPAGGALAGWLDTDAGQVATQAANGCDVWALRGW
jgi:4-amino-4-deoxy-L-arabinose transferase-like glycosyltransferase